MKTTHKALLILWVLIVSVLGVGMNSMAINTQVYGKHISSNSGALLLPGYWGSYSDLTASCVQRDVINGFVSGFEEDGYSGMHIANYDDGTAPLVMDTHRYAAQMLVYGGWSTGEDWLLVDNDIRNTPGNSNGARYGWERWLDNYEWTTGFRGPMVASYDMNAENIPPYSSALPFGNILINTQTMNPDQSADKPLWDMFLRQMGAWVYVSHENQLTRLYSERFALAYTKQCYWYENTYLYAFQYASIVTDLLYKLRGQYPYGGLNSPSPSPFMVPQDSSRIGSIDETYLERTRFKTMFWSAAEQVVAVLSTEYESTRSIDFEYIRYGPGQLGLSDYDSDGAYMMTQGEIAFFFTNETQSWYEQPMVSGRPYSKLGKNVDSSYYVDLTIQANLYYNEEWIPIMNVTATVTNQYRNASFCYWTDSSQNYIDVQDGWTPTVALYIDEAVMNTIGATAVTGMKIGWTITLEYPDGPFVSELDEDATFICVKYWSYRNEFIEIGR